MPIISVTEALAGRIRLGVIQTENLTASATSPALEEDLAALCDRVAKTYREPAEAAQLFQPARRTRCSVPANPWSARRVE